MANEGQQGQQPGQPLPAAVVVELAQSRAGQLPQPPIQAPLQQAAVVERNGQFMGVMQIGDNPDCREFMAKLAEQSDMHDYAARLRGRSVKPGFTKAVGNTLRSKNVDLFVKVVVVGAAIFLVYEALAWALDVDFRVGVFGSREQMPASNVTQISTARRQVA